MKFTEQQMRDPWVWCRTVLDAHGWTSKQVAENIYAPWSTIRGLYNGTNATPRYELLVQIIALCIAIETGTVIVEVEEHAFL